MGDPTPTRLPFPPSRSDGDVKSIAGELIEIARRLRGDASPVHVPPQPSGDSAINWQARGGTNGGKTIESDRALFASMAREIYAIRRQRATIFGDSELFGEPAWDILLDLYIAHVEEKKVSVSSACIGSASPPTTGLRWLGVLADKGFIVRRHDPADQRRVLVRLSNKGLDAMDAYFACAMERF